MRRVVLSDRVFNLQNFDFHVERLLTELRFGCPPKSPDGFDVHTAGGVSRFPSPKEAYFEALENFPVWVKPAMKLRNLAMKPLGLIAEPDFDLIVSAYLLAFLPATTDTSERFEAGLEDKHLTF